MPRQKLLCAEMKKEQIKRVIIIERKAVGWRWQQNQIQQQ